MKKLYLLISLIILGFSAVSQDYKNNREEADRIKNDTAYYWYHGGSDFETIEDAIDEGVDGLMAKVQKQYKSHIIAAGTDFDAQAKVVFGTFKPFFKQQKRYLIMKEGDENECFMYIPKADFRYELEKRKADINYYVGMGNLAYDKDNMGDALRFYYIALMLCYAHPDGDDIEYFDFESEKNVMLGKWLNNRIDGDNGILNSIRFNVMDWKKDGKKNIITLKVSTKSDNKISNINFKFNNGKYNEITNVNNGIAEIVIEGQDDNVVKSADFEIDMSYNDIERESPEAYTMMRFLRKKLKFGKTDKTVYNRVSAPKAEPKKTIDDTSIEKYMVADNDYINRMRQIETAIINNDYESVRHLFSETGYTEYFMKLKAYGKTSVVGTPDYKMYRFNNEVICRSIPMRFSFNNNNFTRDVVFRFDDETKLVTSIAFRLSDIAEQCIWERAAWKVDSRLVLVNFLEDYQTAYAFMQLDYLDKIFADNALIIVGHVVEYKPVNTDGKVYGNNKKVDRTRKSKTQYIAELGRQFKNKDYINIHFTDLDVRRASGEDEEVFGVQVRQYYYSNNYQDEGYLFLMVDLREELPIIYVRTWQPGKTDMNELITLRDIL